MERVYLARHYAAGDYACLCIFEEGVFSTFEDAEGFLIRCLLGDDDKTSFVAGSEQSAESSLERGEIICFKIGDRDPSRKEIRWRYDGLGRFIRQEVLDEQPAKCPVSLFQDPRTFQGKFCPGDIVFVRANLWNPQSHFDRDIIGVVFASPEPLETWLKKGGAKEEWEGLYVVDFIDEHGRLDHDHLLEDAIQLYEGDIPDKLRFLRTLAEHCQGVRRIKESALTDILSGKVFVESVRFFTDDDLECPN